MTAERASSRAEPSVTFLSASPGVWGAEQSLLILAEHMQRQGSNTHLITFSSDFSDRWSSRTGGSCRLLKRWRGAPQSRVLDNIQLWLAAAARSDEAVVVFSYHLAAGQGLLRVLGFSKKRAVVYDAHDQASTDRSRWLLRNCVRRFDGIVSISEYVAEQFEGLAVPQIVLRRPLRAVSPRVAIPTSHDVSSASLKVGIVGRLDESKRVHLVIQAVAACEAEIELHVRGASSIYGDKYAGKVLKQGARLLGSRFHYDGEVSAANVMKGLDVLVVGNPSEPMGRSVIEAQAESVVPVVPNSGGSAELVEHGQDGLIYRGDDTQSLAETLSYLHRDREALKSLANCAFHSAGRYDPSSYALRYIAFLSSAINAISRRA